MSDAIAGLARAFRKGSWTGLFAILILVIVILSHISVFTIYAGVVWKSLPFPEDDRLVNVWQKSAFASAENTSSPVSHLNYLDWKENNDVLDGIAAYSPSRMVWTDPADARVILGASVTGNFFELMGLAPQMGRFLTEEDARSGAKVAVISHGTWVNDFGRRRDILSQQIELNSTRYSIVGVSPASFRFRAIPTADPNGIPQQLQIWIPSKPDLDESKRAYGYFQTIARLKRNLSLEDAQQSMALLSQNLAIERKMPDPGAIVVSYREALLGDAGGAMRSMWLSSIAILLIGSINAAHVLLAQNLKKRKDLAVRRALGGSLLRVCAQPAWTCLTLCVFAGALAVVLTYLSIGGFLKMMPQALPLTEEVTFDWTTASVGLGISMFVAALAFLPLTAILTNSVASEDLVKSMRCGRPSGLLRGNGGFVVTEIALVLALSIGACLMVQSFYRLSSVCAQLPVQDRVTFKVSLPYSRYPDCFRSRAFFAELLDRIREIPAVSGAASVSELPLTAWEFGSYQVEIRPDLANNPPEAQQSTITPDYFKLMGIRLVEGRAFEPSDNDGTSLVAIINQKMRQQFWPRKSPIDARIRPGRQWLRIVGVVEDSLQRDPHEDALAQIYLPMAQSWKNEMVYVYRTSTGDAASALPAIRGIVRDMDTGIPVTEVRPLSALVDASLAPEKLHTLLLAVFSLAALIIVLTGVYGTISCAVENRRLEFGIRQALGAGRRNILWLVFRWASRLGILGIALGLPLALVLGYLLSDRLFHVAAVDATTIAACAGGLFLLAVGACLQPALRACRVDPVIAMKVD